MMESDYKLLIVREYLNKNKIKLWLPPYSDPEEKDGKYSREFLNEIMKELNVTESELIDILERLRLQAIQQSKSKEKFSNTGIATLKLKIPPHKDLNKLHVGCEKLLHLERQSVLLEISLQSTGSDLRCKVSELCAVTPNSLKLISCGVVIQDENSLQSQNIKNGTSMMVLITSDEKKKEGEEENLLMKELNKVCQDARLLLENQNNSRLQLTNQEGKNIDIPEDHRNSLMLGMVLHEKGRAYLKKQNHVKALFFLLEADKEFKVISWDVLEMTDNYALLCLDIVWCYLRLQCIKDLPDAVRRLSTSEQCFRKSYGENNERLISLKGSLGKEAMLFPRLHLLKGIISYHQDRVPHANEEFNLAYHGYESLKIDEEKLKEVIALGYKEAEARFGLRHCHEDLKKAILFLQTRKTEKKANRKRIKEEKKLKYKSQLLGKTLNGNFIEYNLYESLLQMGFHPSNSIDALKVSNNNIDSAIQYLTSGDYESQEIMTDFDTSIENLEKLGFSKENATEALRISDLDVNRAIDLLVDQNNSLPGVSNSEQEEKEREAADRLSSVLKKDEEDHLELNMEEDLILLQYYMNLIKKNVSK